MNKMTKETRICIEEISFNGSDKDSLNSFINQLCLDASSAPRKDRIRLIKMITDKYVSETGERMDNRSLEELGTLLLREELMDKHPDKMSRVEYPIMSDHQYKRRLSSEVFNHDLNIGTGVLIGHRALYHTDGQGKNYHGRQAIYRYPK